MVKVIRNYLRAYWKLLADWFVHNPSHSRFILLASMIVGLASNLPFLILAKLMTVYSQGLKTVDLAFSGWNISILLVNATYATLASSIVIFYLQYAVRKRALKYCLEWQAEVLQRLRVSLISYADIRITRLLLPNDPRNLTALLISSVKSLSAIERLTSLGISHFSIILVATLIIIVLDPLLLVQIAIISLCFLPIYSIFFIRMIKLKSGGKKNIVEQRKSLTDFVTKIDIVGSRDMEKKIENFSALYELPNVQMISLNSIGFLTKIHVIFMTAMVVTIAYHSAQNKSLDFLLIAAVLMLARAGIGITSLLARLARNYLHLSIASKMLYPQKKLTTVKAQKTQYLFAEENLNVLFSQQFIPVFFAGVDDVKYPWQIVPITNAIKPYDTRFSKHEVGLSETLKEKKGIFFIAPKALQVLEKDLHLSSKHEERIVFVCLTANDERFTKYFFQATDSAILVAKNGTITFDSVGKCTEKIHKYRQSIIAEFDQFQEYDDEEDV